jgi:hypothetical protein
MHNVFHIDIDAAPERVFYWLDDAEHVMQWAKGVVENEDLVKTEVKVGSTFRQVFEENGRKMEKARGSAPPTRPTSGCAST